MVIYKNQWDCTEPQPATQTMSIAAAYTTGSHPHSPTHNKTRNKITNIAQMSSPDKELCPYNMERTKLVGKRRLLDGNLNSDVDVLKSTDTSHIIMAQKVSTKSSSRKYRYDLWQSSAESNKAEAKEGEAHQTNKKIDPSPKRIRKN